MALIFVLNGPNLNALGTREPEIYGRHTLADIERLCAERAAALGHAIVFHQTNHEGELVELVQRAGREGATLVINPAAYGHTSVALLDALQSIAIPIVECHLSNLAKREPFRHHSYVTAAARGMIAGFGADSYVLAIEAAARLIAGAER